MLIFASTRLGVPPRRLTPLGRFSPDDIRSLPGTASPQEILPEGERNMSYWIKVEAVCTGVRWDEMEKIS
jgi:hypothetical protein